MDALDGNAIAGALFEYFGAEMKTAVGACAHCGARAHIAELVCTRALLEPSFAAATAATL